MKCFLVRVSVYYAILLIIAGAVFFSFSKNKIFQKRRLILFRYMIFLMEAAALYYCCFFVDFGFSSGFGVIFEEMSHNTAFMLGFVQNALKQFIFYLVGICNKFKRKKDTNWLNWKYEVCYCFLKFMADVIYIIKLENFLYFISRCLSFLLLQHGYKLKN